VASGGARAEASVSDPIPTIDAEPARSHALVLGSLADFDAVSFRVTGDCMLPALVEGDLVRVTSTRRQSPPFGDVVLVATGPGLRLHRLVWGPPLPFARWRTKGDRAPGFDGPLRPEGALGTVVGVEGPQGLRPVFSPLRAMGSLGRGLVARLRRLVT